MAEDCGDFIKWLGLELSVKILMSLEDLSDLVRFSAVSTSWRHFVVENGISKQLCLNKFPELSSVAHAIENSNNILVGRGKSIKPNCLERNHIVYSYLCRALESSMANYCILDAISASSTANYPEESIQNTLDPRERVGERAWYWSSKGQKDPQAHEKLVYKLLADLCIVTEIHVQPFQAYFEHGSPTYSARAVRVRMGYPKFPLVTGNNGRYKFEDGRKYDDSAFVWTYTSPKFPMAQENFLQKFKLPEPVLCIGGILQLELLGRVHSQETSGLYYIRITHVQVVGRLLSPGFDVDIHHASGRCRLKYYPGITYRYYPRIVATSRLSSFCNFFANVSNWEQMVPANSVFEIGVGVFFLFIAFIFLILLIKFPKVLPVFFGTYYERYILHA